jgi:ATP-dependent Lon protease
MPDRAEMEDQADVTRTSVALYDLDNVRAALSLPADEPDGYGEMPPDEYMARDNEHQSRLSAILARGERGRWRYALGPAADAEAAVISLLGCAPHFAEFADIIKINILASREIGLPIFLNPTLLIGEPGIGKTWFLSKISVLLGLPFRSYSMSTSTLAEGIQGAHPSWRNSEMGLVAKTLLRENGANPLLTIDEFDKVSRSSTWNVDPYRAFYTLLDPSGSSRFVDEYLGFEIDASRVLWVMAGNTTDGVPSPIMDRLTVLYVPSPTFEQRLAVIQSIYAEANIRHRSFFDEELGEAALEKLAPLNPRLVRLAIEAAMARAAAGGRHALRTSDIKIPEQKPRWQAGFCP